MCSQYRTSTHSNTDTSFFISISRCELIPMLMLKFEASRQAGMVEIYGQRSCACLERWMTGTHTQEQAAAASDGLPHILVSYSKDQKAGRFSKRRNRSPACSTSNFMHANRNATRTQGWIADAITNITGLSARTKDYRRERRVSRRQRWAASRLSRLLGAGY